MADLLVTIVTYAPDLTILTKTIASLKFSISTAICDGLLESAVLVVVDNESDVHSRNKLATLIEEGEDGGIETLIVSGHGNIGFGAGHNLGGMGRSCRYRLVLNPDVILEPDAITIACTFMDEHPEVGILSPMAVDEKGQQQFLCKRYPSIFDLFVRGFAPGFVKKICDRRLAHYEMRDSCRESVIAGVTIVSGCFMFIRQSVWEQSGGFDQGFFLYFEDFDLSLRIGAFSLLAYVPMVKIVHFGGNTARKGLRHISMFLGSSMRFYRLHGLRFL